MYSPDTMRRLNAEAVAKYFAQTEAGERTCEYCNKTATHAVPVYNPADSLRDVEGAYSVIHLCDEHHDKGYYMEELFYCDGCGELFVSHHSWDVLCVEKDGAMFCQKCALESFEGVTLRELVKHLQKGNTKDFLRANSFPGKKELVDLEFSEYSDFPGCTSLEEVADEIVKAALEEEVDLDSTVYPLLTHTYQFSVALSVYY